MKRSRLAENDKWRVAKIETGMPAVYVEILLRTFRAARHGDFAATNPALEKLLGRQPLSLRDVMTVVTVWR